jgi:hypothetical protein
MAAERAQHASIDRYIGTGASSD